jgi:hypothetical protein
MKDFIKGLELSRRFYAETVRPIVRSAAPGVKVSAALIGSGSEVLGFDTEMSADHHWGPRVMLFLSEPEFERYGKVIDAALRSELPPTFLGFSANFSDPDPNDNNVQHLQFVDKGPINHRVELYTIKGYIDSYLDFDIAGDIEPADWLTFPQQKLLTLTAGEVFEDELGLEAVRDRFRYYPHDIWLYMLASGWNRIGQEEHLMGRAGMVGDETGSALIAARLVRDVMSLCFLMERRYAPYPKWFGTAFRRLRCAPGILPSLDAALRAATWTERERAIVPAYEHIAAMHNDLGITGPRPDRVSDFFGRPFKVIELSGGFSNAIRSAITDPAVKEIATRKLIGGIDQFSDSTDILSDPRWRRSLKELYRT